MQLAALAIKAANATAGDAVRQGFARIGSYDGLIKRYDKPFANGSHDALEQMLARFPRLRSRIDQRAGLLSGGEQQMLAIARALMAQPDLLLLDKPSLGLAPQVAEELFLQLRALREEGMSLLIVDQLADLALAVASRAYVLSEGRVIAEGTAATIAADPALAEAYLGAS